MTSAVSANLDAATDGTELLKYLATSGTASGITVATNGDKAYLIAYDNGKAYLYHADSGADTSIAANEIKLVGVFEGVAAGSSVPANVLSLRYPMALRTPPSRLCLSTTMLSH